MASQQKTPDENGNGEVGPRGILRVPEVLIACASKPNGASLAILSKELQLPKTSLHRLLRTLEYGGYLSHKGGNYVPGPASFHLANLIGQLQPNTSFPANVRGLIEWLARETSESVMLGVLSEDRKDMIFISAIDSTEPLRYTLPIGERRPLSSGASGKTALAFFPAEEREAYLQQAEFRQHTPYTTRKEDLPALLRQVRRDAVVYDRNGNFEGASAIASPVFDKQGTLFATVSLAGPTYRTDANRQRFETLTRATGERISRMQGYLGEYPPTD